MCNGLISNGYPQLRRVCKPIPGPIASPALISRQLLPDHGSYSRSEVGASGSLVAAVPLGYAIRRREACKGTRLKGKSVGDMASLIFVDINDNSAIRSREPNIGCFLLLILTAHSCSRARSVSRQNN